MESLKSITQEQLQYELSVVVEKVRSSYEEFNAGYKRAIELAVLEYIQDLESRGYVIDSEVVLNVPVFYVIVQPKEKK